MNIINYLLRRRTVNTFTPFEYILIAAANAFGQDKLVFEERIEWAKSNGKNLRKMLPIADDIPLATRAVLEIERIRDGARTTQFMMGLDACASGVQVLASLCNDHTAAQYVGLVDPNKRCDVYASQVEFMNQYLPEDKWIALGKDSTAKFTRDMVKYPFMTHFYDSTAVPEEVFGERTIELLAFYRAVEAMCPGVSNLILDIKGAIKPDALSYAWTGFDGFRAITDVMVATEHKVIVEGMKNRFGGEATFTHIHRTNAPDPRYKALLANVTHNVDSGLVNEMDRRCNHDKKKLLKVYGAIQGCKVTNAMDQKFVSLRECDALLNGKEDYTDNELGLLARVIESVIDEPTGPLVTVHDEFKSYPHMMNSVRKHYRNILAEVADSNSMERILRDLYKDPNLKYTKEGSNLGDVIRQSQYALA